MILNAKRYFLFFLALVLGFGIGNTALATCYQGGDDPYVKEKCYQVDEARWYEYYCKDKTTVVQYQCVGGNCTSTEYVCSNDCHPGYEEHCFCSGGKCVAEKYCWEADFFKDIYHAGGINPDGDCTEWVKRTRQAAYWDTCHGNVLTEYFCKSDGSCGSININCADIGAGGTCAAGARICTAKPDNCYDSDGGKNIGVKGRCTDGNSATISGNEDTCTSSDNLIEWYCESELKRCVPKIIPCGAGNCSGGKCVGAAAVIEPSKLQGPNQCCLLNHKFTDVDPACDKGVIVGPANAQWCDINGDGEADTIEEETVKWGTCCFLDSLYTISDWVFVIFFPLAVVVFTIAGGTFMFSGGEPNKVEKAKGIVFWGIIGLIIVLFAKIIPAIVKAIIG